MQDQALIQYYNRMLKYNINAIDQEEIDESIQHRVKIGNNSGYLDDEYELSKDFPSLEEYHFRIEDDSEILSLEKLRRQSLPINIQSTFNISSQQFKIKLNQLLDGIDSRTAHFGNNMQQEKHGFYKLKDSYDDESFLNSMVEESKVQELRVKLQEISIKDIKPVFIKKKKIGKVEGEDKEVHKLSKKFNRITISEQNL